MAYINQFTLQYKTYVKRAASEAMAAALTGHPDPTVSSAKVAIDFTGDDFELPAVIIKFNEEQMPNAGVGHYEWLPHPLDGTPGINECILVEYQHRMYKGTIEFDIYGMSSADRDFLSDAVVEVLTMDEVSAPGQAFINRFYNNILSYPYGQWHFATLNFDLIQPSGESIKIAPWNPEDTLVYNTSYKVPIFGEFYSYTPPEPAGGGFIDEVDVYPYIPNTDPSPPVPSGDYYKYTGWPEDERLVPGSPTDAILSVIPDHGNVDTPSEE